MSHTRVSDFMLQLSTKLREERKLEESTANNYLQNLYKLNGNAPFKTLTFLKNTEEIEKRIAEYAPSTQKTLYTIISSVLALYKDKSAYKKTYDYYSAKMNEMSKVEREKAESGEKSEKQEENWIDWTEVKKKASGLKEEVSSFRSNKHITPSQFDTLTQYMVLSLYTDIPPRRNQDYMTMSVVKKWNDKMPSDENYLCLSCKKFIYNKYKTAKSYGQQSVEIPDELMDTINLYLKYHPNKNTKAPYKFLVKSDGSPFTSVNVITRILNKIFAKKIGSSMLRHIYLTSKFGDDTDAGRILKEKKEIAEEMGHSVGQQQDYIKH